MNEIERRARLWSEFDRIDKGQKVETIVNVTIFSVFLFVAVGFWLFWVLP